MTNNDDERKALARVIDPGEWEDVRPRPGSFPDAPEAQATYERFFWEGVENRRKTSLLIADRLIAAGIGFRRTAVPEPQGEPTDVPDGNGHHWMSWSESGKNGTYCRNCGGWAGKVGNRACEDAQGEAEWEYGRRSDMTGFTTEGVYSAEQVADGLMPGWSAMRRRKAGPWMPVPDTTGAES